MPGWEGIANIAYNAFVATDPEDRITAWNLRAEEMFGIPRERALGRDLAETILPERYRRAHREGLERFRQAGASPLIDRRLQLSVAQADGSEFPAEMTITAVADSSGYAFYAVIADRSELRASERERERLLGELRKALQGSEQRFAVTLDALAEGVTIRGEGDRLLYANRRALDLLGLGSVDELRREDPNVLMERSHRATTADGRAVAVEDLPSAKVLRGRPAEPLLLRVVSNATGEETWTLLKAAPITGPDGEVQAAVTIIEDVTADQRAARRHEFLSRASELLGSSLDFEQTLRNVAGLAVPWLADWCAVDLFDEDRERERVAIAHSDPSKVALAEKLREREPDELDAQRGLGLVLHTGAAQLYADITDEMLQRASFDEEHLRLLRAVGMRSALIVPLRGSERTVGALTLVNAESVRSFDAEDMVLAERLAERAALAVENARLYRARTQMAHTLQRSLLPDALPEVPGWEIEALYRPAGSDSEVGGDFYDVWSVGEDWLVLIGDVTGKGVGAASLTSLARHTARTASEFDPRPSLVLARIDRALRRRPRISLCTALCMRIRGPRVELAAAGHPLPLLLSGGSVRELGRHGLLLGADDGVARPEDAIEMGQGDVLVAITDGVTDTLGQRGERFGWERLRERLARCSELAPAAIIDRVVADVDNFQAGAQADDTAILVARFGGQPRPEPAGSAPAASELALGR